MLKNDLNRPQLEKLLVIKEFEKETIFSTLGRMRELLNIFKSVEELNHLVSFLHAYIIVTEKITERMISSKKNFDDEKLLEKFNNYFASLYFKPLHDYILKNSISRPWSSYFKFCRTPADHPLIQLLLGANVHINSDLCQAVADLNYTNEKDFRLVQEVLFDAFPEVMWNLAFEEKDILGLGGIILNDFYKDEFKKVVIKWRNNAHRNAEKIKKDKKALELIQKETDELGDKIIDLWNNWYKPSNILNFLKDLNSLQIIL